MIVRALRRRATIVVSFSMLVVVANASCVGTTGSGLVDFPAYASGPRDVDPSKPFEFDTGLGWHVLLTRARVHVGALYLNRSVPTSGAQATSCVLPGIYVAQVTAGVDVDVLSPKPQPFSAFGHGTADRASAGEVWLTGGDVQALDDPTTIIDVAGVATRGGTTLPFVATFTIGKNRAIAPNDVTQPGANPICKQRIASPIAVDVTPKSGGALYLEIDPRGWFRNVDFAQVPPESVDPPLYRFVDSSRPATDSASRNLFLALHASDGVYRFTWGAPSVP